MISHLCEGQRKAAQQNGRQVDQRGEAGTGRGQQVHNAPRAKNFCRAPPVPKHLCTADCSAFEPGSEQRSWEGGRLTRKVFCGLPPTALGQFSLIHMRAAASSYASMYWGLLFMLTTYAHPTALAGYLVSP